MMDTKFFFLISIFGACFVHSQYLSPGAVEYYCGNKPADVAFLIDSSNSIWGPDFHKQVNFINEVVDMFQIGQNRTRISLATYSTNVHVEFHLNENYERQSLRQALSGVRQRRGFITNTKLAIWTMRKKMFSEHNGARPGVVKVAVVLTDGQSNSVIRTVWEAMKARREGIHMFAIGIGAYINRRELRGIASKPVNDYMFEVSNFGALESIKNILAIKTCVVTPRPTTTRRPTTTTTTTPMPTTTTTTPTTTTTTPTTTTTSMFELARSVCSDRQTDIVFAFDSSNNVRTNEFYQQVDFAKKMIELMSISAETTRVASFLYSDQIQRIFELDDFDNADSMKESLNKVSKSAGRSRMSEAIRYVRTKTFRRSVARDDASQVAIIITGSPAMYLHRTKVEASKAREAGITLIPIGIGDVNIDELRAISGAQGDGLYYELPSFNDIGSVLAQLAIQSCQVPEPVISISDQSCGSRQAADLMFILDSMNAGKKNTKRALAFIRSLISEIDIDTDKIQVGLMSAECQDDETGFALGERQQKDGVLESLSNIRGTDISQILKQMRRGAFSPDNGGRKDVRKIAVLIIDGKLEEPIRALTEAQRARIHGIEVFVIQVGEDEESSTEARMMSDAPTTQHYFQVPDYAALMELKDAFWAALCDEL
ncbi:cartilage matrix protein-like [Ylistrum balloti]|uniref:cartilage matrix protein-like n=1 Tax=Ylistrum balloti TaxID=509963 RepID=UPI00290588D4|nr:cartilage matrix protein-like [Ylistrum balloti]